MRLAVSTALLLQFAAVPLLPAQHTDIVRTARNAGQFATLLAAVDAAGLTSTLRGDGPFTLFAPTDEAFRRLPSGTVEELLKPENRDRLRAILLYHVVPRRVSAQQARNITRATTVQGSELRLQSNANALQIDDATVVKADVGASNGVIHVIDEVLMPREAARSADRGSAAGRDAAGAASQPARGLIDLAIARGVPLYNNGQPAATIAIYEVAARGVLALQNGVPAAARTRLETGLREADRTRDEDDRAWVLRRTLDEAARIISGRRMMPADER
jgi:uncharacterized surface protein with fasciclin (FAS1) repeats